MEKTTQIILLPYLSNKDNSNVKSIQNSIIKYFGTRNAIASDNVSLVIVNFSLSDFDKQVIYKLCNTLNTSCIFQELSEYKFSIYNLKNK